VLKIKPKQTVVNMLFDVDEAHFLPRIYCVGRSTSFVLSDETLITFPDLVEDTPILLVHGLLFLESFLNPNSIRFKDESSLPPS